jgi:hypothetical protein
VRRPGRGIGVHGDGIARTGEEVDEQPRLGQPAREERHTCRVGALPRLLVLIGSGETAPRMARVHRALIGRLAGEGGRRDEIRSTVIDTPYGFQSNADAISADLTDFLGRRLGTAASVASLRRADGDLLERETALARIRDADLVFSGPGSPTYAARQWAGTEVPGLLAQKLESGGAVVLASAAAMTAGRLTVPVYEIYKAGEDPRWLPGLDLLSAIDLPAAVITHWDNTEGGDHDTRYCFLGERRLRVLEEQLPDDTRLLGIDEHTALLLDLGSGTARVEGRGRVTVRQRGREQAFEAGREVSIEELGGRHPAPAVGRARVSVESRKAQASDVEALVRDILETTGPDQLTGIVRLGELAGAATAERDRLVPALISALLEVRDAARGRGDWVTADDIRARLGALGVELHDTADGRTDYVLGVSTSR